MTKWLSLDTAQRRNTRRLRKAKARMLSHTQAYADELCEDRLLRKMEERAAEEKKFLWDDIENMLLMSPNEEQEERPAAEPFTADAPQGTTEGEEKK